MEQNSMELEALLQQRYSCRSFDPKRTVETEKIEALMAAATLAPSACNMQPYCFEVVQGPKMNQLNQMRNWYLAPALIFGCYTDKGSHWVRACDHQDFRLFDLGLSMMALALKATELGLDSCFIGSFDGSRVKEILGLQGEQPQIALAVGYAAPGTVPGDMHFTRKQGDDLFHLHLD